MKEHELLHELHVLVERQFQLAENRRDHLRAEHLVAVEGPAHTGIVGLRERLGDVVQHGGPAQPQIAAAARHVVHDLERMDEIVLMGVAAPLLHPLEVVHLGKNPLQQPGEFQQLEAHRRDGRKDDLVEFGDDAFARDDADAFGIAADRLEGLFLDGEAQLRGEPDGAHHAQRVVGKGDVGIAWRADDALFEVRHPVERIDQLAERGPVQRPRHGVDREVAPPLVVRQRAGFDLGFARIAGVGLPARAHELDFDIPGADHRRAESLEDRDLRLQFARERLGQRNAAAHNHHVDVGRRPSQVVIAHIAADDESLHALLVGKARNPPEYGIRQRHAATSRVA